MIYPEGPTIIIRLALKAFVGWGAGMVPLRGFVLVINVEDPARVCKFILPMLRERPGIDPLSSAGQVIYKVGYFRS